MATEEIKVPDIGDFDEVPVIEVLVKAGDSVEKEQSLITLESEKATMEVPSPKAGTIREMKVGEGDKVTTGSVIAVLEPAESSSGEKQKDPARNGSSGKDPKESGASKEERPAEAPAQVSGKSGKKVPEGKPVSDRKADLEAEVVVLGSGPGGYTAAFRAADLGCKVVLVERYPTLGGVCLNVGCIPSKALLHAAKVIDDAKGMRDHGVDFGEPAIDSEKLYRWQRSVVEKLTGGLASMAKKRGVTVVQGKGRFSSSRELAVTGSDGEHSFRQGHHSGGLRGGAPSIPALGRPAGHGFHAGPGPGRDSGAAAGHRRRHHRAGNGRRVRGAGLEGQRGRAHEPAHAGR